MDDRVGDSVIEVCPIAVGVRGGVGTCHRESPRRAGSGHSLCLSTRHGQYGRTLPLGALRGVPADGGRARPAGLDVRRKAFPVRKRWSTALTTANGATYGHREELY